MSTKLKEVPVEETSPDKAYFIAVPNGPRGAHWYWSRMLNGKEQWTVKAGIAIQYYGGENLVEMFRKNASKTLIALEVPDDADKRWKARKRRSR